MALGHPLLDDYLEFVAARSRRNTLLATAYDLKVFDAPLGEGREGCRTLLHRGQPQAASCESAEQSDGDPASLEAVEADE